MDPHNIHTVGILDRVYCQDTVFVTDHNIQLSGRLSDPEFQLIAIFIQEDFVQVGDNEWSLRINILVKFQIIYRVDYDRCTVDVFDADGQNDVNMQISVINCECRRVLTSIIAVGLPLECSCSVAVVSKQVFIRQSSEVRYYDSNLIPVRIMSNDIDNNFLVLKPDDKLSRIRLIPDRRKIDVCDRDGRSCADDKLAIVSREFNLIDSVTLVIDVPGECPPTVFLNDEHCFIRQVPGNVDHDQVQLVIFRIFSNHSEFQ